MRIAEARIHQLIVPMKPDTVHSPGASDTLCAPEWEALEQHRVPGD